MKKESATKAPECVEVHPVKSPFGLTDTYIAVYSDGSTAYHWRMKWWYAIYQAFKMCLSPEMYRQHSSGELERVPQEDQQK